MALLILFGFIAGAGTALSPCVLPVLPIALAAGATGGNRRPLGIVVGLAASFTFATVALVYLISALGLPDTFLRTVAIVSLLGFGIILLIPKLSDRFEAAVSGFTSRFASRSGVGGGGSKGDGFWSGTLVGASLGIVYAPCAGPILAGVITVSASQAFTIDRLTIALSYAIGSSVVLYFLMLGGRRLTSRLARRSAHFQMGMAAVMIATALAMLGDYDLRFQTAIAQNLPGFLINPTESLETNSAATKALAGVRDDNRTGPGQRIAQAPKANGRAAPVAVKDVKLKNFGPAPDFVDNQSWFNTAGGKPLTMDDLRGRVVLVDFWTYSCINCLRTLPYLESWDKRYRKDGLTIVGVHTPEFPFEKDSGNVGDAVSRLGIRYPVAQDNDYGTWNAYANQYWPAEYFIDADGNVRYVHFGEGDYAHKEDVIRALLADAGKKVTSGMANARDVVAPGEVTTPESYLGSARARNFVNGSISTGERDYGNPDTPGENQLAYSGRWKVRGDSATAAGGSLELEFGASHAYLVLGSHGHPRRMRVLLDGKPISAADSGADVSNGVATIDSQRLYDLVSLPQPGRHLLTLEPDRGVTGYAFTFG